MKIDSKTYLVKEKGSIGKIALLIGIAGLAISFISYFNNSKQFYFSYLTAFAFWTSLGLGGLFFTMLHHISGAKWSTIILRIPQAAMSVLPLMAIFFIPIIFGIKELYEWSSTEVLAGNAVLSGKTGYLNSTSFITRTFLYFIVWGALSWLINKFTKSQDEGNNTTKQLRIVSAPGMVVFALSISFAAFDWLMSLDPMWFSTIFGGYFFSGSFVIILAFLIIVTNHLKQSSILGNEINDKHFADLGKLFFGFIVFWAYIGGAQYFFIWYANIPEETIWFLHRWEGSWKTVSLLLIFGHFLIPFVSLVFYNTKRSRIMLLFFAIWIFVFHYVDMFWLVGPALHHGNAHFSWMDLTTFIGLGGIFIALFLNRFSAKAIIPVNDPNLKASLDSHN